MCLKNYIWLGIFSIINYDRALKFHRLNAIEWPIGYYASAKSQDIKLFFFVQNKTK